MKPGKELLFLALGGSGEIGMNANLYGCDGKWVLVDLGMTFADAQYPGIDLVFPDMQFIEDRARDLLGVVLTHAHEDHIGAVPYFAAELGVPLFATPFTARLVAEKLAEQGLTKQVTLNVVPNDGSLQLGPFGFRYVPLAHSIAEGNGLVIDTPYGRIFHTGDWKLDENPLVGVPASAKELTAIGDSGVLALVCDSTNVFNDEASGSEADVRDALLATVKPLKNRVVITTFASNVARMQSLGEVANATGRKLCVAGRSLDRIISTAQASGYLKDFPDIVDFDTAMRLPRNKVMIIATGGQGEARAALGRISSNSHQIRLEAGDTVLFSSKQIPGNEVAIGRIQNALATMQVDMITERQADIHVSGHPGKPELKAMYDWIRPKILMPVHGEMRHMREQALFGAKCGIKTNIVQKNGDLIRLAPGKPGFVSHELAGRLVLDGDIILPADGAAINERRKLALNGILSVAAALDDSGQLVGDIQIVPLGVPLEEGMADFISEAAEDAETALREQQAGKRNSPEKLKEALRLSVRRTASRWTGKKPVVNVMLLEV